MEEKTKSTTPSVPDDNKQLPAQYIRQPYPISAIQADLSTQQIRILVAMMKSVQDGVQKMFERVHENSQLNLFSAIQDDRVNIDFKFSDVASHAYAYADVEQVAKKFMQVAFRYEDNQKGSVIRRGAASATRYASRSRKSRLRWSSTSRCTAAISCPW